jgi:hypothetical protein
VASALASRRRRVDRGGLYRPVWDALQPRYATGILDSVDEEVGIYRDEVLDIIGGLADISSDTIQTLAILRGDDEEDHEEEEDDA